ADIALPHAGGPVGPILRGEGSKLTGGLSRDAFQPPDARRDAHLNFWRAGGGSQFLIIEVDDFCIAAGRQVVATTWRRVADEGKTRRVLRNASASARRWAA